MKFVLGLEYDGSMYFGWQKQKFVVTIQGCIEHVLSKIANHKIHVVCAGRTDRGVHALTQIVHFNTNVVRSHHVWLTGMNALLPNDITVLWLKEISCTFDARFSALSRSYRYIILNQKIRSSFLKNYYFYVRSPLNIKKMKHSAKYLLGEHDFTSFKSSGCQSYSSKKNIISLKIYRVHNFIIIDITANSFLYHMVRNIVGCLILIGLSKKDVCWTKITLCDKNIKKKYSTVPPQGLYFLSANYSNHYSLPKNNHIFKNINLFTPFF